MEVEGPRSGLPDTGAPAFAHPARERLLRGAVAVLERNRLDGYTAPAPGLYCHQHLWDSCFVAIGERHYDLRRAMGELEGLFGAQWRNGMIPHIVFLPGRRHLWDRHLWRSRVSADAPPAPATGGISQPPMIAEAVARVGERLGPAERRAWYRRVHGPLVAYHEWLYREREREGSGLVVLLHPWESGLDNAPPWLAAVRQLGDPWWIGLLVRTHLDGFAERFRWDARYVPPAQRTATADALRFYDALRRIRRLRYSSRRVLEHPRLAVEDLAFNCILVRANTRLREISAELGDPLPERLLAAMRRSEAGLAELWDERGGAYFSRDVRSGRLLREPSIAALLPLYSGAIDQARAEQLAAMLDDPASFAAPFPVPTVPPSSPWFDPVRYWQGPTWVNTNWLIADGLERYGLTAKARRLRERTIELVALSGFQEYFDPLTGAPAGAADFSWTAALTIDLLAATPPGAAGPGEQRGVGGRQG